MTYVNLTNCLSTGALSRWLVMKEEIISGLLHVGVQCAVEEVFNGRLNSDALQNDV